MNKFLLNMVKGASMPGMMPDNPMFMPPGMPPPGIRPPLGMMPPMGL